MVNYFIFIVQKGFLSSEEHLQKENKKNRNFNSQVLIGIAIMKLLQIALVQFLSRGGATENLQYATDDSRKWLKIQRLSKSETFRELFQRFYIN